MGLNKRLRRGLAMTVVICILLCEAGAVMPASASELGADVELTACCGEIIDLSDYVDDKFKNEYGEEWQWKMYKDGREILSGSKYGIGKSLIDLGSNNIKAGEYELRLCTENLREEAGKYAFADVIKLKVLKIPLIFDIEGWNANAVKNYDATDIFEFAVKPVSAESGARGLDYYKNRGVYLKIRASACGKEGGSSDVGTYSALTVQDISISDAAYEDFFDITELDALSGSKKVNDVSLVINPARILFERFPIVLEYHSEKISVRGMLLSMADDFFGTVINSSGVASDRIQPSEELLRLLVDNLGEKNVDNVYKRVSFANMSVDDSGMGHLSPSDNVEFLFSPSCFTKYRTNKMSFSYINEDIRDTDIPRYLEFKSMDGVKLCRREGQTYSYWCNDKGVKVLYEGKGLDYFDSGAYDYITYKAASVSGLEELKKKNIYETYGMSGDGKDYFNISSGQEEIYIMMFGKNKERRHAAVAAVIHVVPEDATCECPEEISGYPIITLFTDNTAPSVVFKDDELNRTEEMIKNGQVKMDSAVRNDTVSFTVFDDGSGVDEVRYAFIRVKRDENYDSVTNSYRLPEVPIDETLYTGLHVTESGEYEVKVPDDIPTGDIILYVRSKNKSLLKGECISNAMIVDKVSPAVGISFVKQDGEELTERILNGDSVYCNQDVRVSVRLEEEHFSSAGIIVSKINQEGELLGESVEYGFDKTDDFSIRVKELLLDENGNYKIEISAVDVAGNSVSDSNGQTPVYYITVDKDKPCAGSIEVSGGMYEIDGDKDKGLIKTVFVAFKKAWNTFATGIKYNVFGGTFINYVMTGRDEMSPVEISYYISGKEMTEDELVGLEDELWEKYDENSGGVIGVNTSCIIYEKVSDKAGNTSYFSTEGIITDTIKPEIKLSVAKPNEKGFYKGDVSFDIMAEDKTIDGKTRAAGIQYVAYRIEKNGKPLCSEVLYDKSNDKSIGKDTVSFKRTIYAKDFNSNDVVLYVTVADNSGNVAEEKRKLSIDTAKPVISVTYDGKDGEKYYNHVRTATVTIKERNLDTRDVKLSVKGKYGSHADIGKWESGDSAGKSDDATYTCRIVFSKDDDYELSVDCTDKAGNRAEKSFSDKFTLDLTKPVISVEYEGGEPDGYYAGPVTAVIRIAEHNFNEKNVAVRIAGENDRQTVVPDFKSNGDEHRATIIFDKDGSYRLQVSCEDKAGNRADDYKGNSLVIDMCKPEIEITNIQDKSANKGEVKPIITCSDLNYTADGASFTLCGANNGEINLETVSYTAAPIKGGQQFVMDFPKAKEFDDLYTLTVKVRDKAGNETDKSIEFSVNRFGSVYTLGGGTKEWLVPGECAYIKESRQVVIVETNVDEIASSNIAYSCGGVNSSVVTIADVNECDEDERGRGYYYEIKDNSREEGWHQYEYVINKNNFFEEERYKVQIDTVDKAGNHTSNINNKQEEGSLDIEFAVDCTPPDAVITGADNGEMYNEESHTLYVDVQDNMALDCATILVDGREYGTYSAEEIEGFEGGLIPVRLEQSISMQTVKITAKDKAGNILGGKAEGSYDKSFEDFRILVTTNVFVRLLHSVGVLIIMAALGGGLIIIICHRKRTVK